MAALFQQDYWDAAREGCGYYAWAQSHPHQLRRFLYRKRHRCPCCDDDDINSDQALHEFFERGPNWHPLLDTAFSAFVRAEIRFSLRFVPQRSHEERLTGNFVSEIEAAVHLANMVFRDQAKERYGEPREFDFVYYDMSRGGSIEKHTGADLAVLLHIELPDRPRITRFASLQAKKFAASASLEKQQFDQLRRAFPDSSAYLFYDMDLGRLAPPMVVPSAQFQTDADKDPKTESFSVTPSTILNGMPLSLWLFSMLAQRKVGEEARDFKAGIQRVLSLNRDIQHGGRLAVISIGRPIQLRRDPDQGLILE